MAPEYHDLAVGNLGGIPTPVAIVLALWLAAWLVTERTLWGKYVRAIGQNSEAARIAGIRDRLTMLGVLVTAWRLRRRRVILPPTCGSLPRWPGSLT